MRKRNSTSSRAGNTWYLAGGDDGILRCFDLDQNGEEGFRVESAAEGRRGFNRRVYVSPVSEFFERTCQRKGKSADNDDENLIMNDVALGASACGERLFHPSTGEKIHE